LFKNERPKVKNFMLAVIWNSGKINNDFIVVLFANPPGLKAFRTPPNKSFYPSFSTARPPPEVSR
jgi:hypothetical protein